MARNYWRGLALAVGLFAAAFTTLPAFADEAVLSHDAGVADTFEKLNMDAHYISFATPASWPDSFSDSLSIYGRRYGDVSGVKGNIVLWGLAPKPARGQKPDPDAAPLVILGRMQFDLSSAPEQAGWFTIPLEPVKLPGVFVATVYTFSTETRGLEIGLTSKARDTSHSAAMKPEEAAAGGKGPKMRHDGREWLIRAKVRNSLVAGNTVTAADLSGDGFAYNDDGSAEGFTSVQKNGPMVKFHTDSARRISKIHVFCSLAGDWFETTRQAGVWVMDYRWGILNRQSMNYSQYTNVPSWGSVDIPGIEVSGDYYILIEPVSRPEVQLLVGYDASGENKGSYFGDAGAILKWSVDAPEEATNWMVRVEYE